MKFPWHISAGQFFELFRPAALLVSALLSTWVLASARRSGFRMLIALAWAIGTFFLPFVLLPLYLIVRVWVRHRRLSVNQETKSQTAAVSTTPVGPRFVAPLVYGVCLFALVGSYLYRDHNTVDAHLARAAQAKLPGRAEETIREYRAALALEDSAHTHKLLGIELAAAGQWAEAINEFRAAERGGEPDDLLPFRIGQALDATGHDDEAKTEYITFLKSKTCTQSLPDERCAAAGRRVGARN